IHDHVRGLQARFLASVDQHGGALTGAVLLPGPAHQRGHFLTYRTADAERLATQLAGRGVRVDHRGDRLRLGFGVYHSTFDVDRLVEILTTLS
ncbi:MAG TPA: aminotransferase, partial [Beutenbergiaceae bacterium]|nr:aminotransferase [Beutenbergiaceae bacterium]